ncbi:pilin [Rhodanobacter sp. A1T4]|uniref:pilin n=1 Tax=Rhodanobacter sp. A1T4 TaxID=2723087 RepID=UPI00160714B4|nr:pilin [Rhodanobacter sp. A1T4]MBB6245476.1 type IV pilus assembly protein PilA [Rhodanobacter sp. A1T4]
MKSMQKGFTLIELMIVVAIIAILAAIAIPAYQTYITKTQFAESQTVADGLKTPIVEYFNQTGACPVVGGTAVTSGGLASTGASYAGKYVASATVGASVAAGTLCPITVTFKAAGSVSQPLGGYTVVFNGTNNGGTFTWSCVPAAAILPKYTPATCH